MRLIAYTGRMRLMTWEGTILRVEARSGRLTHSRLVPRRDLAADLVMELPPEGLARPFAITGGMVLVAGKDPATAHLMQDGKYLRVRHSPYPLFQADTPTHEGTLVLLPGELAEMLRDLLLHGWQREDTGETIAAGDTAVELGPVLRMGAIMRRLPDACPRRDNANPDRVVLPGEDGGADIVLLRVPESAMRVHEISFEYRDAALIPDVADEAAFHAACPARLTLPAPSEIAIPPMLLDRADRNFAYRRVWKGWQPESGRIQRNGQILRDRNKYVLLERGLEGMILDEAGVANEYGYVGNLDGLQPPHFGREGERYFLDRALLDKAPRLQGSYAVFFGGNYQNYYHWLIDAMVPLSLMASHLPADTKLLLPGSFAYFRENPVGRLDYLAVLDAFGFGDRPRLEVPGQICHVDEIFWPGTCTIEHLPASAVSAARDRAVARRRPPSAGRLRIAVRRDGTRAIADDGTVDTLLRRSGFTILRMEELDAVEQIDLFHRAEIVVAAHGAALANLLFCREGTQVLELSPDVEYRPFFAMLCAKLGLGHAVLPCPTDDGTFNGALLVDARRLGRLLTMVSARLAP